MRGHGRHPGLGTGSRIHINVTARTLEGARGGRRPGAHHLAYQINRSSKVKLEIKTRSHCINLKQKYTIRLYGSTWD